MSVHLDLNVRVDVLETLNSKGASAAASFLRHLIDQRSSRPSGTASKQQDLVYGKRLTITTTHQDLDLAGGVVSDLDGSTITMAEVTGVYIRHRDETTGQNLLIGGATNALGIFANASDIAVVGPGGLFIWESPVDGVAVTGGSTDELRLDASAGSFLADVLIVGRSA